MTLPSQQEKRLREELRARVFDFKISQHLLGLGDRKPVYVKSEEERMYDKLETWIFDNIGNIKIEEPEEEVVEPDTNDPSLFPAEGSDLLDF